LQQAIGAFDAAGASKRASAACLLAPVGGQKFGEKFPLLIEQIGGCHAELDSKA
jgi:hypothetical protein